MLKVFSTAFVPSVAKEGDAGIDLRYSGTKPFKFYAGKIYKIPTGTYVEIPKGKCGIVLERSGLGWNHGIHICGRVIDSGYRGQIYVLAVKYATQHVDLEKDMTEIIYDETAYQDKENDKTLLVCPGDKIAQMVILPCFPEFKVVSSLEELTDTERGADGLGSTGSK